MNSNNNVFKTEVFADRHHGAKAEAIQEMLKVIKADSIDQLIEETIPQNIRLDGPLKLSPPSSEVEFLKDFQSLADQNDLFKSYIGMGYYDCHTPKVILRNILENPAWYTAYTPYQAEIAQGRLEALINFQTVVIELTGMEIANASLLDEATAAAEAMAMLFHQRKGARKKAPKFFVSEKCFPQTIDVLKTRAAPIGIELVIGDHQAFDLGDDYYGFMLQYPDAEGTAQDYTALIQKAKELGITSVVAADLLSLTLLTPPGEMGADVVVGTTQRFGIPMGFGGPHAAYFATHDKYKRNIPGRIIGVSKDKSGDNAFRMALQTREQHIRREKATSNICTSQVLLAVMAGMYAVYHGPDGLRQIGLRVHMLTQLLSDALDQLSLQHNTSFFDTLTIKINQQKKIQEEATQQKINFAYIGEDEIRISLDETTTLDDVRQILEVITKGEGLTAPNLETIQSSLELRLPEEITRSSDFLEHTVFNQYHTEHEMLRYIKHLESKDLSLVHSMISLGSCTMKLNATTEMIPVSWPKINGLHPFAPKEQTQGYQKIIQNLSEWLQEITGFDAISMQPNSGAQGEYAGLMAIRSFLQYEGQGQRNIALIPASAHGTNPASAVMAGMKVVVVKTDEHGNIDVEDLRNRATEYKETLACLMVTYPSTHGVFEESIIEVCQIIHDNGGQVYMDGANMNAQVGFTSPGKIGADVCHLNLHKTFCIPHGGGGPGMGPICVKAHLQPHLAAHAVVETPEGTTAISAAPFGSASILPISYAYIAMMGAEGLTDATSMAILNANYIKERISSHYDILYTGQNGRAAHEMIVDCRAFKKIGVEVEDIAKRLMDYGFHAPTVSFPVAGTLMIEPTESESKAELDRFCDALIAIRNEIKEIEEGKYPQDNNLLKNAPHTLKMLTATDWAFDYSREEAAYPLPFVKQRKFWASVARIDSAYGDRNLMCSCIPISDFIEE